MNCHRCPTSQEIKAGKYRNTPWADTPCASCQFSESGFALEYDENRDTRSAPEEQTAADLDVLPVAVLTEMAAGILRLSPPLRDIITRRLAGQTYKQIASDEGITIQAAERRHQRALRQWPQLAALFPRKIQKQKTRRKPHHQKN